MGGVLRSERSLGQRDDARTLRRRFRAPIAKARLDNSTAVPAHRFPLSHVTRYCLPIAGLMLVSGCAARSIAPTPTPEPAAAVAVATVAAATPVTDTTHRDSAAASLVTDSEVVTRAAAIFDGPPAATPVSGPVVADARATWDIDVRSYETHEMVARYVGIFTGRAREYMERSMSRGTQFDAMLRRKFRESGLPEDMTYLALIESSYSPHAYSHAAAVGMWQFMAPTARGIGMRVDWWVDERRDPMRSTDGAIDFLTDLHDAYGSWYLAAAAYNGGPGRMSRGLKRFSGEMDGSEGEDRFFALAEQRYLPTETKAYVPKLIAAALIAKEPSRYGLRVDTLPPYLYDSVNVSGGTTLAAIAKASGTTLEAIRDLNPHFLRGVTPPNEISEVRVPVGASRTFDTVLTAMPESERIGWHEQRIASARSVEGIAEAAGVPMRSIRWVNPKLSLDRRGRVRAGTLLRIPTLQAVAGARDVPDPSIARYGSGSGSLVSKRVRVRSGESLASVARRTGVSVSQLKAMNGIRGSRVRSGQMLVVRRPSKRAIAAARRSSASRSRAARKAAARSGKHKHPAATKTHLSRR
jgi:membrane-bound lytic murein transglycosylase D